MQLPAAAAVAACRRRVVGEGQDLVGRTVVPVVPVVPAVAVVAVVGRTIVDLVDLVDLVGLVTVVLVDPVTVGLVGLVARMIAGLVGRVTVDLAARVTVGLVGLVTSAGLAARVTSVVRAGTTSVRDPMMPSTASGTPPGATGQRRGVGERRRGSGGTGRCRLRVASGTRDRSITGATTRRPSGIRAKTAGVSTSSASGLGCRRSTRVGGRPRASGRPPAGRPSRLNTEK